jgi:hypothetical protein
VYREALSSYFPGMADENYELRPVIVRSNCESEISALNGNIFGYF